MSVLRRVHTNNFTIIGNALLNDAGLSAEAVGVICYLIGKPHNWVLQPGQLSNRFNCGADRIQRILKELIEAGYIRKVRQRDPATQQWQPVEYIVLDTRDDPLPENTLVASSDEPLVENPLVENPALQRTDSTKTESNKPRKAKVAKPRKVIAYTEEFEALWKQYPSKDGTSKAGAFKNWQRLVPEDQERVKASVPIYARMKDREKFTHHLEFYISRRIFDTVGAPTASAGGGLGAADFDRQTWENLGKIYENSNDWRRDWGPEPGKPGCRMPPDLQQQFVNPGLTSH